MTDEVSDFKLLTFILLWECGWFLQSAAVFAIIFNVIWVV